MRNFILMPEEEQEDEAIDKDASRASKQLYASLHIETDTEQVEMNLPRNSHQSTSTIHNKEAEQFEETKITPLGDDVDS
jgi:hypothetical protein